MPLVVSDKISVFLYSPQKDLQCGEDLLVRLLSLINAMCQAAYKQHNPARITAAIMSGLYTSPELWWWRWWLSTQCVWIYAVWVHAVLFQEIKWIADTYHNHTKCTSMQTVLINWVWMWVQMVVRLCVSLDRLSYLTAFCSGHVAKRLCFLKENKEKAIAYLNVP